MSLTKPLTTKGVHWCIACGDVLQAVSLAPIRDIQDRLYAGGVVPSGQCPTCGALCYPIAKRVARKEQKEITGMQKFVNYTGYDIQMADGRKVIKSSCQAVVARDALWLLQLQDMSLQPFADTRLNDKDGVVYIMTEEAARFANTADATYPVAADSDYCFQRVAVPPYYDRVKGFYCPNSAQLTTLPTVAKIEEPKSAQCRVQRPFDSIEAVQPFTVVAQLVSGKLQYSYVWAESPEQAKAFAQVSKLPETMVFSGFCAACPKSDV